MAIRLRKSGALICAAMSAPEEGDSYIDDRLHYQLSVVSRAIVADVSHSENGLWHWVHGGVVLSGIKKPRDQLDSRGLDEGD